MTPPLKENPIRCATRIYKDVLRDWCNDTVKMTDTWCRTAHCIANCKIVRECEWGTMLAKAGSWWKEHITQGHLGMKLFAGGWFGIPRFYGGWDEEDSPGDYVANQEGRRLANDDSRSCEEACKARRGIGYPMD